MTKKAKKLQFFLVVPDHDFEAPLWSWILQKVGQIKYCLFVEETSYVFPSRSQSGYFVAFIVFLKTKILYDRDSQKTTVFPGCPRSRL